MRTRSVLVSSFIFLFLSASFAAAQNAVPINCNQSVMGSFTRKNETLEYTVDLHLGDHLNLTTSRATDNLRSRLQLYDPHNSLIGDVSSAAGWGVENPVLNTQELPFDGTYTIKYISDSRPEYSVGNFTLYVECIFSNAGSTQPTPLPDSNMFGFSGLPAKDFSNSAPIPLILNSPNNSGLAANSNDVTIHNFDANAGDIFALDFARLSGNLNLGLAVLSPDNKTVFQASLVTSDSLSTQFTLPSDGTYTIGVWRIDLLPPASPENTAFQITGTINP